MSEQAGSLPLSLELRVSDLLGRYPVARAVLDRHGLGGCGWLDGPNQSLGFFAQMHGVDERTLLDDLRRAIAASVHHPGGRVTAAGGAGAASGLADGVYRLYFLGAIAVVLSAGAVWGAWLLWRIGIAGSFSSVGVHPINAHGHAQIFGWVGLFIMGFALQILPRMWRVALPAPRLAIAAFAAMVLGIAVRTWSMASAGAAWAAPLAMAAGAVELAAIATVVSLVGVAFLRSDSRLSPAIALVFTGLAWFVIQAVFGLWHTWTTMTADDLIWYVSTYQGPLRDMQIHGLALCTILGVSMRMLPPMFGLPRVGERRGWWVWGLMAAAPPLEVVLFIAFRWTDWHALAGALLIPWLMIVAAVILAAGPWRLWRPMPTRDRSAKFIRIAYGWLAASLVMLLLMPVYLVAADVAFSHAYYGAIRHAITVGFISMMIVGVSAKVVPALTGRDGRDLPRLWGPFVLINLGCLLRVSTQTLTDWSPMFFGVIGVSGTLEVIGLALWGAHLARLMLAASASPSAAGSPDAATAI